MVSVYVTFTKSHRTSPQFSLSVTSAIPYPSANLSISTTGLFVNVASANSDPLVDLGLRIPVGFQVFPLDPLELFLEFAPSVGVQFSNPVTFPNWSVQGAFGFRFWF